METFSDHRTVVYNVERVNQANNTDEPAGIRWWPALSIVAVAAVAWVVIQTVVGDANQQYANMGSGATLVIATVLLGVWLLYFSRLQIRVGLTCVSIAALAALLFFAGFRVRGVTGNLLPLFEWRWGAVATEPPPARAHQPTTTPLPGLADYPQFLGPTRDGVLTDPALERDWGAHPPVEVWRRPVGAGWSGFAVAGRHAVTLEQHGDDEAVCCYDVASGDVLWMHRYSARYDTIIAGVGPRTTPTIRGGQVFALGATGLLHCLDLRTGDVVWRVNILTDNGAPQPEWGVAGSPLILGDHVVVSAGGPEDRSLVAYSATDGALVWGGGSDSVQYSSPRLAAFDGVEQILIFNTKSVASHDPSTGEILWEYAWKATHPHVCQPVSLPDDELLISSGYGTGSQLVKIARGSDRGWSATPIWRSLRLKAKFTNLIALDGHVYGLDDGIFTCVDLETGRRRWKRGRFGHGQIILADDLLLVMTESGEIVLVDPVPDELRELTRFKVLDRKTWNPPALAGAYLLVRNDVEAACYRLPLRGD